MGWGIWGEEVRNGEEMMNREKGLRGCEAREGLGEGWGGGRGI
jgi:hypothetical protein